MMTVVPGDAHCAEAGVRAAATAIAAMAINVGRVLVLSIRLTPSGMILAPPSVAARLREAHDRITQRIGQLSNLTDALRASRMDPHSAAAMVKSDDPMQAPPHRI